MKIIRALKIPTFFFLFCPQKNKTKTNKGAWGNLEEYLVNSFSYCRYFSSVDSTSLAIFGKFSPKFGTFAYNKN